MADYNTFNVVDCKSRKIIVSTSSARKAARTLEKGKRVDVWNNNTFVESVYDRNRQCLSKYIKIEKEYIAAKQKKAHERKNQRRMRALLRTIEEKAI